MRGLALLSRFLVMPVVLLSLWGCRTDNSLDMVIASVANPSHTLRATLLQRQYVVEGRVNTSPTTYVLLRPDTGKPGIERGEEFPDSQVVVKAAQCGPLSLEWVSDGELKIRCEKCGISQAALGPHARAMEMVRIDYEAFPDLSSWETAPRGN